jgi:hypothetical protein
MHEEESVSKAYNEGFEAGINFAKAQMESETNNPPSQTTELKHDFGCLIYICTCKVK